MSDGQEDAIRELLPHHFLDMTVGFQALGREQPSAARTLHEHCLPYSLDAGSSFVCDDNGISSEQDASHGEKLTLSS